MTSAWDIAGAVVYPLVALVSFSVLRGLAKELRTAKQEGKEDETETLGCATMVVIPCFWLAVVGAIFCLARLLGAHV